MEWYTLLLITLAVLLVALASGMRIFLALTLVGIILIWLGMGIDMTRVLGFSAWGTLTSFSLAAVPLFIFMGEIVYQSGLSQRAYAAVAPLMNHLPGGLLHTNVVVGAIFAAASGSSVASAATIGTIAMNDMEARGYDRSIALGSIAAGGSLGILIPPSITLIIYGVLTLESIGKLFIAGIIPGLILTALYMSYISIRVAITPKMAPRVAEETMSWGRSLVKFLGAWPIFLLSLIVLGSIYGGVATPSEAASVGAFAALVIAAAYRQLNWQKLKLTTLNTIKTTCFVILIFLGAKIMGALLSNLGVFGKLSEWVVSFPVPPIGILSAILLMYLILGCFMSGLPAIVITLPIVFPIITTLGYDPIWFGIMIVLVDEAGLLSPPVGNILYILQGLRPEMPFRHVAMGCLPFFGVIVIAIVILVSFPNLATWLPGLMYARPPV